MAVLPDPLQLGELIIKRTATRDEPHSPVLSSGSSSSTEGSLEESGPPTPVNGPPQNYDTVVDGLYRSSFPRSCNFEYLNSLKLKTIVTLVEGPHPPEYTAYLEQRGIVHHAIPLPAHKQEADCIPAESMAQVLDLLLDRSNYPLLVHCNKGKHRTGCAIACYRICSGQAMADVIDEYRNYAGVKARVLDERYIQAFTPSSKHGSQETSASSASSGGRQAYPTPPASDRSVHSS